MEIDVKHSKQRTKRRERAQRMQAERDNVVDGVGVDDPDSADEDSKKPIRPPQRRKKLFKEPSPILEEDVVDGFAILSFKTYEDLEYAIKLGNKRSEKRLSAIIELTTIMVEDKLPKIDTGQIEEIKRDEREREREWKYKNNNHHITHNNHTANNLNQDPGTSDDSGRASERLTTSSVAQRDQDSSRDRLSDASSRCSSGKGYICDSEGDDDKGSDGGSVVFASTPTQATTTPSPAAPRKSDFPTTGLPLSNGPLGLGGSASPVPVPSTNSGPAPSPAPAALPPPSLPPPYPTPMQNGPLNTHLTSLPNHNNGVGPQQSQSQQNSTSNGQQASSQGTQVTQNGVKPVSTAAKIPSTCTTTSTTSTSPNSKQQSISPQQTTVKQQPTISNLLGPTQGTAVGAVCTTSASAVTTNGLPPPTNVTAIPSPVSSTSSLSSVSIPSRLGSSTPPTNSSQIQSLTTSSSTSSSSTVTTTTSSSSNNTITPPSSSSITQSQPPQPIPSSHGPPTGPHPGLDRTNSPAIGPNGNVLSSVGPPLSLPHSLNGTSVPTMPSLISGIGLGGIPLGHLGANGIPAYRSMYAGYPLYPYGLHNPYGLPPAVPAPPVSPRIATSVAQQNDRRDSPLVLSKPVVRPVTPNSVNSNSNPSNMPPSHPSTHQSSPLSGSQPQSMSNLRDQHPHQPSPLSHQSRTHSPRGHSPSRERDSYSSNISSLSRSSAPATPSSSVIPPYNNSGPQLPAMPSPASSTSSYTSSSAAPMPPSSLAYPKTTIAPPGWPPLSNSTQLSPATSSSSMTRPTPPPSIQTSGNTPTTPGASPFGASSLFAAPLPPPAVPTSSAAPHPFSAEALFSNKVDQTDMLRRELDNRFLDRSGLVPPPSANGPSALPPSSTNSTPPTSTGLSQQSPITSQPSTLPPTANGPYLRQELHHHQHQHTHLHQHQHQHQTLLPTATPAAAPLFPPPLFKDVPKIGAVDSPFYRTTPLVGMPPYPYPSSLLHPGLSGPTQFVPPSHLQSFVPKQQAPPPAVDPTKPKQVKTGRWNAMHVRIAWEIYHHQAKQNPEKAAAVKPPDMLRPPSHMYPPSPSVRPHEIPQSPTGYPPSGPPGLPGRGPFDPSSLSASFLGSPSSHLGVSPFGRYASPFGASPFTGLSPFARDIPIGTPLDPWRNTLPRTVGSYPPPLGASWPIKPDPSLDAARREAEERERQMREREREERERERQRREREERERKEREREEKLRKEQQEREQRERERERKEKERREMERREMERERMLQQQRLNESSKAAVAVRDRSPLRNGTEVKEEPRKDEDILMRADPRYHQSPMAAWHMAGRHPAHVLPPPHLSRSMLPPTPMVGIPHYAPGPPGWPSPLDPYRDYRFDPMMRYGPMLDAMRAEEAKALNNAAHYAAHYRAKDPSPVPQQVPGPQSRHHQLPPGALKPPVTPGAPPPSLPVNVDMHKKEDSTQAR